MNKDSVIGTFVVAGILCLAASIVVSTAAVSLKPLQAANKVFDRKVNILQAAGLYTDKESVDEIYSKRVTAKTLDLKTGEYLTDVDPATYDPRKMANDPVEGVDIPDNLDLGKIKKRARYAVVYEITNDAGGLDQVVLPVHGKGLWSTLWGFMAVDKDANTIKGLGFYEHAETPGLGGEIDNPNWKKIWIGKKLYKNDTITIEVIKGAVNKSSPKAEYQVDGISGATITVVGVSKLVQYWLGQEGYQKYLSKMNSSH